MTQHGKASFALTAAVQNNLKMILRRIFSCPNCHALMRGSKYDPSWADEMEAGDAIFGD